MCLHGGGPISLRHPHNLNTWNSLMWGVFKGNFIGSKRNFYFDCTFEAT